jgi:hypothetical protein
VQGSFAEGGIDRGHVAVESASELRQVAEWLGDVIVAPRGDLSDELQAAVC